jgi:hypothetical protein
MVQVEITPSFHLSPLLLEGGEDQAIRLQVPLPQAVRVAVLGQQAADQHLVAQHLLQARVIKVEISLDKVTQQVVVVLALLALTPQPQEQMAVLDQLRQLLEHLLIMLEVAAHQVQVVELVAVETQITMVLLTQAEAEAVTVEMADQVL